MKLSEIKDLLNAEVLCGDKCLNREISTCFACDLISEMLIHVKPRSLLVTSLMNAHVIHTAQVMDASAVVFVGGKKPDESVIKNGEANSIPILATEHLIFDCCGMLFANGILGNRTSSD